MHAGVAELQGPFWKGCALRRLLHPSELLGCSLSGLPCAAAGIKSPFFSCSNLSAALWSHLHPANMLSSCQVARWHHSKALTSPYPGSRVERSRVPEDKVGWLTQWEDYNPVEYTAAAVLAGPKWADPQLR